MLATKLKKFLKNHTQGNVKLISKVCLPLKDLIFIPLWLCTGPQCTTKQGEIRGVIMNTTIGATPITVDLGWCCLLLLLGLRFSDCDQALSTMHLALARPEHLSKLLSNLYSSVTAEAQRREQDETRE